MSGGDMGYLFHCFSFTGALTHKEVLTVTFKLLSSTKNPTKRHASPNLQVVQNSRQWL